MADSDDEYNDPGRRRDKFVRERNDYSSNRGGNLAASGWQSNQHDSYQSYRGHQQRTDSFGRNPRPYQPPPNRHYQGHQSSNYNSANYDHTPNKRGRLNLNTWNENRYSQGNFESNYDNGGGSAYGNSNDNMLTQPPMMTFKQYMRGLDDSVDHVEAAKKYNEYKNDFKRKQIVEFFTAHKDEEWFRVKYHPVEGAKRKKELRGYVKHRAQVFFDLHSQGLIESTSIDIEKSDQITNVLDSIVIKLEGGTDFDLKCLEAKTIEESKAVEPQRSAEHRQKESEESKMDVVKEDGEIDTQEESILDDSIREDSIRGESIRGEDTKEEGSKEDAKEAKEQTKDATTTEQQVNADESFNTLENEIREEEMLDDGELKPENKGERTLDNGHEELVPVPQADELNSTLDSVKEDGEQTEEDSSMNETVIERKTDEAKEVPVDTNEIADQNEIIDQEMKDEQEETKATEPDQDKELNETEKNDSVPEQQDSSAGAEHSTAAPTEPAATEPAATEPTATEPAATEPAATESAAIESTVTESTIAKPTKGPEKVREQIVVPRPLHRTLSIFLRYLPANVTRVELETLFDAYPNFLRIALADPTFDKRFQRRGWITFDRNVDIRKVYLSVSNQRIRECEIGAIINRDLSRRIRSVNGIASHRLNVLADLKHTIMIILNLDEERAIWNQSSASEDQPNDPANAARDLNMVALAEPITVFDQPTRNPLLVGVEECFKEKTGEETVDDTGEIQEEEPENEEEPKPMERDEALIRVLDKLVFYLRVVHSLDYYNHVDYPNEDEMPNRIGIMHARGMLPTANVTLKEVKEYIKKFETSISPYLERVVPLTDEEIEKLGKRDAAEEVEKFIKENIKELKPDKFLCPLSNKKFKGPEFVRKHIEVKHEEKLDNVRHETEFFNLYLADPRRPQLPEHQFNKPNPQQQNRPPPSTDGHSGYGYGGSNIHQRINFNQGGYNNRYGNNSGYNNSYNSYNNRGRSQFNTRKRFYRDLDAPTDDF